MKKLSNIIILACALIVTGSGCSWFKQPTVQQQTVKTLFTLHKTVDAAFDAYLDLVVTGKLPSTDVARVTGAYSHFQDVYNAAIVVVANNQNAVAPQNVIDEAANFNLALGVAKKGIQ